MYDHLISCTVIDLQGCFNLYSDGIEHGCRLVAELPLYSHPTTPLSSEDQISFSNIFRALEDDPCSRGPSGIGDKTGGAADACVDLINSDVSPEQPSHGAPNTSDRPLTTQGAAACEDLPGQAQEPMDRCNVREAEPSLSLDTHITMVFPEAANTPSHDPDERSKSPVRMKASLPSEGKAVVSGDGPTAAALRRTVDGLRFLIVVSLSVCLSVCLSLMRRLMHCRQDDSALNRKIIRRILEGECKSFSNAVIEEADDGTSAVSAVRRVLAAGLSFDFIFMDFVMVRSVGIGLLQLCMHYMYVCMCVCVFLGEDEWSRGSRDSAQ